MASRLKNVHLNLTTPGPSSCTSLVKGDYEYWHYCCDGVDDRGWGCGYRTLQTLCSWVQLQRQQSPQSSTCQQDDIQQALVAAGNQRPSAIEENSVVRTGDVSNDVICVIASGDVSSDDVVNTENIIAGGRCQNKTANKTHNTEQNFHGAPTYILNEDEVRDKTVVHTACPPNSSEDAKVYSVGGGSEKQNSASSLNIGCPKNTPEAGSQRTQNVPSLLEMQKALVTMGDKPAGFAGSRQWIGSYEVCLCLDFFFDVPCKIIHINQGSELRQELLTLKTHFSTVGSPVMMGGDSDASSKGIMGVCTDPAALLVVDPHCSRKVTSAKTLQCSGWVQWILLEDFHQTSFYNLCLPQLIAREV